MKRFVSIVAVLALAFSAQAKDKEEGFVALFDGKTLKGWTTNGGQPMEKGWVVKNGEIYRESRGGDIFTAKTYANFDFRIDWKVAEGSNSGIKYRFTKYTKPSNGPEYQVLDDDKHPDAKKGDGQRKAACLYDIMAADTKGILNAVGKWNSSRIVANGPRVEHWLNGKKVLEYDTSSEAFKKAVMNSKFRGFKPLYGTIHTGRIMLQDHSDPVWYRNIRIKVLPGSSKKK